MEINNRFLIAPYLGGNSPINEGDNPKLRQLISKSQTLIQEHLNSKSLQEVFKNKSVAMLFLDKTSKITGKHHPDSLETRKFMNGPLTYSSMELIRHLSNLITHQTLSPNILQNLRKWITSEQSCLPISLIFDAWSSANKELILQTTMKGGTLNIANKIELPKEEVETFIDALSNEIKSMKPGGKLKMPAGSLLHITRLEFTKTPNDTFDIIHFNTGSGAIEFNGKKSTACKYTSISAEKIEDPLFWMHLIEVKMQPTMEPLNLLLANLNPEKPPIDLDEWLKKPAQESNSCSFKAALAEFKHSFITGFQNLEEGWSAYKLCTSLMTSEALIKESSSLEPSLARMLFAKEKIQKRYQEWLAVINNPEKLEIAENTYLKAMVSIGCCYIDKNNTLSPFMRLSFLDNRLHEGLNFASHEQLNATRDIFSSDITFDGFSHIGYKQLKWLESTREILQDVVQFAGWRGELLLKIRNLSTRMLPLDWDAEIQTKLNYANLDKESLTPLLNNYILREAKDIGNKQLQLLTKEGVIKENFTFDESILESYIKNCASSDPQKALELADKPVAPMQKYFICMSTVEALTKSGHFKEALELADKLELDEKQRLLMIIAPLIAESGNLEEAISVSTMTGPHLSVTQELIVQKLCLRNEISNALAVANKIQIVNIRYSALTEISYHLAKQGDTTLGMKVLKMIPWTHFKNHLDNFVQRLLLQDPLDQAVKFISLLTKEFYSGDTQRAFSASLNGVVRNLLKKNKKDEALSFISEIPSENTQKRLLNLII